jgi:hypothetical protein
MTIMATHGSAIAHEETPHVPETTTQVTETTPHESETTPQATQITISDALRRRAQAVIHDGSIDLRWRAIVRYGLETNDPWLADLVRRAGAGETIIDSTEFSLEPKMIEDDSSEEKIEALAGILCRSGDDPESRAAALFVLMGTLEHSHDPKVLANAAKHYAFTRCGELNVFGIVDSQIAIVESQLLDTNLLFS